MDSSEASELPDTVCLTPRARGGGGDSVASFSICVTAAAASYARNNDSMENDEGEDEGGKGDDPFEVVAEDDLEPLPEGPCPAGYPQENQAYFATKRYVRNDKYPLSQLVALCGEDLPSMKDAVNM